MQFNWDYVPRKPPSIVEYYLEEAHMCLKHKAYRMSVMASTCALNFGLDFVLRKRALVNKNRVLSLNEAIEKVENQILEHHSKMFSKNSLKDCKKVMHYRNAFAHPEKYLEVKPSSKPDFYILKPKFETEPEKEQAYFASEVNAKRKLKTMAEESLEIAFNSIKEALEKSLLP